MCQQAQYSIEKYLKNNYVFDPGQVGTCTRFLGDTYPLRPEGRHVVDVLLLPLDGVVGVGLPHSHRGHDLSAWERKRQSVSDGEGAMLIPGVP